MLIRRTVARAKRVVRLLKANTAIRIVSSSFFSAPRFGREERAISSFQLSAKDSLRIVAQRRLHCPGKVREMRPARADV